MYVCRLEKLSLKSRPCIYLNNFRINSPAGIVCTNVETSVVDFPKRAVAKAALFSQSRPFRVFFNIMYIKVVWLCLICVCFSHCLPTVYKYNENKILEPGG